MRLLGLLAVIAALAGCGDLPRPFQPEAKVMPVVRPVSPEAAAILREPVMVAVQPVTNLPAEGGPRLAAAMAVALRNEGIAADIDPRGPSYTLAAIANVRELPLELEIKVTWFLLDTKGFRMAQIDQVTRGRVEDWMEGNDRLISRIAQNQSQPVAAMITLHTTTAPSQRAGAPVQGPPPNGIAPPSGRFTPQTVGGMRPPPPEKPSARERAAAKVDLTGKPTLPATAATTAPAASPAPPAAQPTTQQAATTPAGKPQLVRIVVPRVEGAPGDGPDSLAAGMKRALGRRNFAIVPKTDPGSLTVRGKVEMKPFNNNREVITITWAVLDAQNNQVGEIEQSNVIPGGSLNGEWGPIAREITVAAAEGLLDLLDKASKAARQ